METNEGSHYDELIGKRILFALLANQDEDVLTSQVDNIRYFNPNAGIVLYNGGTDPDFAMNVNVCKFPYSHPLKYGNLTPFLWEVMKWLEEIQVDYDYLVNLDHDVLFVKHGFETFLDEAMAESDCMGWGLNNSRDNPESTPIHSMANEWHLWQPIFQTDSLLRYFNPGQVYRHDMVRRMLSFLDHSTVEQMLMNTEVFALEEVFFVTLAMACGGRIREYPEGNIYNDMVRWGENVTFSSVAQSGQSPFYWIHPIKGQELIVMSQKVQALAEGIPVEELQQNPEEGQVVSTEEGSVVQKQRKRQQRRRKRWVKYTNKRKIRRNFRRRTISKRRFLKKRVIRNNRRTLKKRIRRRIFKKRYKTKQTKSRIKKRN